MLTIVLINTIPIQAEDKKQVTESNETDIGHIIHVNGEDVDPHNRFKGYGAVTANNTSRLLLDYKEEHPEKYWEIMNLLFHPQTGAGLAHVKVELGGDINSSSGTEPATMRYPEEPANVLRGAGFQFAADAKSINPKITTEILRWGEPRWTWNGAEKQDYEPRYQWYKKTIDAVYEEFGFKVDYVGISQNERAQNDNGRIEVEWLKYFTSKIKQEPNYEEDYQDIKLVAADGYRDTSSISAVLLNHPELIDEIDVISSHYGLTGSPELTELQEHLKNEGKAPKEVWVSEGIAPMINARYRTNMEPHYQGLGGKGGILDVATRIINVYAWNSAQEHPLQAISFDFQPAVASFYQGSQYNPKHLISAFDPWSGFFEMDGGIQAVRQIMNFVGYDDPSTEENERWQYIQSATFSDGAFFDGGVDVDTSTHSYMTLKDPQTDDYTVYIPNNSNQTRQYTIQAENLTGKENEKVYVWETRGPEQGEEYDKNWFNKIAEITPENGKYSIEVKPYSIITMTTLDKHQSIKDFEYQSNPINLSEDTIMPLPYEDDFEYDEYPTDDNGRDYVERRGGTPRYTTDQIGAFEIIKEPMQSTGGYNTEKREIPEASTRGNLLEQKITPDIIGADWAVWGGTDGTAADVSPNTNIGDFRWVNYKVSYDFLLDTDTPQQDDRDNYALIGLRQVKASWSDSQAPYNAKIYIDGTYEILRLGEIVKSGQLKGFDPAVWHQMTFEAKENEFTLYLDGTEVDTYIDENSTVMAGRVVIGSGYYNTLYDNLRIEPVEGYPYQSVKIDSAQGKVFQTEEEALGYSDEWNPIGYIGEWEFIQSGYAHYNRTQMRTTTDYPVWNGRVVGHQEITSDQGVLNKVFYEGDWSSNDRNAWGSNGASYEITFKGNEIRLYGEANPSNGTAEVYLDGELVDEISFTNNSSIVKMVWSAKDLSDEEHVVKVVSKEKYTSFVRAEIETEETIEFLAETRLAPGDFVPISNENQIGDEENTVYAYRDTNTWGYNDTNAWANFNDNPYLVINFTGTGIDFLTNHDVTEYNFILDGEDVGNFGPSSNGVRYSVRDLEEGPHTLMVSLGDNEKLDDFMDYRGVVIYHSPEQSTNSFLFQFEGSGFQLFGATPDALVDIYVDDEQIEEDYRIYAKGDRETSYAIRGLDDKKHTVKVVIKGGEFVLDGVDIIQGASTSDEEHTEEEPGDKEEDTNNDDDVPPTEEDIDSENDDEEDSNSKDDNKDRNNDESDDNVSDGQDRDEKSDDKVKEEDKIIMLNEGETVEVFPGYIVKLRGTAVKIQLPDDLPEGTQLTINKKEVEDIDTGNLVLAGDVYDFNFNPSHTSNYTLTLGYHVEEYSEDVVAMYHYEDEQKQWQQISGVARDGKITAEVNHFSTYGVFVEEVKEEQVSIGDSEDKRSQLLPNTATALFNYLVAGVLLLITSFALLWLYNRKKAKGI